MGLNHSPRIVTDGLILCLDAANIKSYRNYNLATYSQDFTNAVYTKSTGLVSATGLLAPDNSLTATTLTDDVNGAYEYFARSYTVPSDSSSYNLSLFIKKTTGGTSTRTGFNLSFTGGTAKYYNIRFNADTGVATGGDSNVVTSETNDFWRLSFAVSNNNTGNTSLNFEYYPATGFYNGTDDSTATGSHTVWGLQVTRGATLLPYKININDSVDTWNDLSGKDRNGTLINSPVFSNSNGGTMYFDATAGRYVSITYDSSNFVNTDFTWFAWVKGKGSPTVNMPQIGYGSGSWPRLGFIENTGIWYFQQYNSSGPPTTSTVSCGSSSESEWKQICCVGNFTQAKIIGYNNGIYVAESSYVSSAGNVGTFGIGRAGSTFTGWNEAYLGSIALVKVYNRALSAAEVQQNFNALRGRFGL